MKTFDCSDSSNLDKAEYDDFLEELTIHFKGGSIYKYVGVPNEKWIAFQAAPSKGSYIHQAIKPEHPVHRIQ